jgi:hypothetical protein
MKRKAFRFYNFGKGRKGCISHSLLLLGLGVWSCYLDNGYGWFRVFGVGIKWKDTTRHKLMFSERYGYSKGLYICKWRFGFLK